MLVDDIESLIDYNMGPHSMRRLLLERHTKRHAMLSLDYYTIVSRYSKTWAALHYCNMRKKPEEFIPTFSEFNDPSGYNGFVPSNKFLLI
jgi:hypothetical protein